MSQFWATKHDRVLLWDTDEEGRVMLSGADPAVFSARVRCAHLCGGTVLVRPAELFESDHVFISATDHKGDLRVLLDAGKANLLLQEGSSLEGRLNWKFGMAGTNVKKAVIHQGRVIQGREIQNLRDQLQKRVDEIRSLGWTDKVASVSENLFRERSEDFYNVLERVWIRYRSFADKKWGLTDFLRRPRDVIASRGDLYPEIETTWSDALSSSVRNPFCRDAKAALTAASALAEANAAGGRISELRPDFVRVYASATLNATTVSFAHVVLDATRLLVNALRELTCPLDWRASAAARTFHCDAKEFVEMARPVRAEDRRDLEGLLFHPSGLEKLKGQSLVEWLLLHGRDSVPADLESVTTERLKEYQTARSRDAEGLAILLVDGLATLVSMCSQVISMARIFAYLRGTRLPPPLSGTRVVLSALRRPLSPR